MLLRSQDTEVLFSSFIMLLPASVHLCCPVCSFLTRQTPMTPSNLISSIISPLGKFLIPSGKPGFAFLCASTGPLSCVNLVSGHRQLPNLLNWEGLQVRESLIYHLTSGPN